MQESYGSRVRIGAKRPNAIHLTSALMLQETKGLSPAFAIHDGQQATAARAFGFVVLTA